MESSRAKYGPLRHLPIEPAREQEIHRCLLGLISLLAEVVARDRLHEAGWNGTHGNYDTLPALHVSELKKVKVPDHAS